MTEPNQSAQHPALSLPGFTKDVTLSTGVKVHIRKVNVEAITLDLTREIMDEEADLADLNARGQIDLALRTHQRLLDSSLVQPTLAELSEMYGARPQDTDFGLGPDMDLLLAAIDEWSGPTEKPALPKAKVQRKK